MASRSEEGLCLTLANRDLGNRTVTIETELDLNDTTVTASVLFEGQDLSKYSTWESADEFELESLDVSVDAGGEIVVDATEKTVIKISGTR